jgi:hypothetical protein
MFDTMPAVRFYGRGLIGVAQAAPRCSSNQPLCRIEMHCTFLSHAASCLGTGTYTNRILYLHKRQAIFDGAGKVTSKPGSQLLSWLENQTLMKAFQLSDIQTNVGLASESLIWPTLANPIS